MEIWAESNIDGFHDEHIEIDEVIAPVIRELNLKGYKTKFCCSGHSYTSLNEAFTNSEETAKGLGGLVKTERTDNEELPIRALYIAPDDYFYISLPSCCSQYPLSGNAPECPPVPYSDFKKAMFFSLLSCFENCS